MKDNLLVSFSGGLTSGKMTKWIMDNLSELFNIVVVFANTGKEREETLEFVNDCDKRWGFNTIWVEAVVNPKKGKGTTYKVVSFETASRKGEPFEEVLRKYGLPNIAFPHCTRELKQRPIHSYVKNKLGWKKYNQSYFTAIGIRIDEVDRVSSSYQKLKYIYPFVSMLPTTKLQVNSFWLSQPFTLKLKSYQGNCDLCFKKSDRKLLTILKETPEKADWWNQMEQKYGNGYFFYRGNRSISDLLGRSKSYFKESRDDSKDTSKYRPTEQRDDLDTSYGCSESCEPF